MNKDAQRIAIAEACGWTLHEYGDGGFSIGWLAPGGVFRKSWWRTYFNDDELPDYTRSLDAMHEAEKVLDNHPTDRPLMSDGMSCADARYIHQLVRIVGAHLMTHEGLTTYSRLEELKLIRATAAQRAEAFLKTLNLWTD